MARPTAREDVQRRLALLAWVASHPRAPLARAAAHFDTDEAAIRRDVEAMWSAGRRDAQTQQMLDFDAFDYEDGYLTLTNGQALDRPLRLTPAEAEVLALSVQALADLVASDPQLAAQVDHARQALARAAQDAGRGGAEGAGSVPGQAATPGTVTAPGTGSGARAAATGTSGARAREETGQERAEASSPVLAAVRQALREGRRVRLTYVDALDARSERDVEPIELTSRDASHVVLRAWCLVADDERSFRLDRIVAATVLDTPVAARPRRRRVAPVARSGSGTVTAEIDLAPEGRWLTEEPYCESVREHADGTLTASVRAWRRAWLVSLVLQAGGAVRAVRPSWLADEAAEAARQAIEAYATVGQDTAS